MAVVAVMNCEDVSTEVDIKVRTLTHADQSQELVFGVCKLDKWLRLDRSVLNFENSFMLGISLFGGVDVHQSIFDVSTFE